MKKINESNLSPIVSRGDFTRGIPFYGTKGDFNFTVGRSRFTPGISIKNVPLTDMSKSKNVGLSELDKSMGKIRYYFKPGDRIRGILVNSLIDTDNGKMIVGKLESIKPDYSTSSIRAFIKNPKNLKVQEIYVQSMERIYENNHRALTFDEFLGS